MINCSKIHRKMWFYVAKPGKTLRGYYEVFKKTYQEHLSISLSSYYSFHCFWFFLLLFFLFFQIYFGEKMWLILYFSKFWNWKPNSKKNCGFIKKSCYLRAKPHFLTKWSMLSTQNEMIFFNIPLISHKKIKIL